MHNRPLFCIYQEKGAHDMLSRLIKKPIQVGPAFAKKAYAGREQLAFYQRLRQALPNCTFFPDIALAALIKPTAGDVRLLRQQQRQLEGRHLAYGVFNDVLELLCVIELSDSSAKPEERAATLSILQNASIQCFSWECDQLPSSDQILRAMSGFTDIAPARFEPAANSVILPDSLSRDSVSAPRGPAAFSLHMDDLLALTPKGHVRTIYPHVWERISLFCNEPRHLEQYLSSLSLQDRGSQRNGFSEAVLLELSDVQNANARFISTPTRKRTGWDDAFIHR